MKIAIAQIKPIKGDIERNIEIHNDMISLALAQKTDAIFFPELSITGYEPELADNLKTDINNKRFKVFQDISSKKKIIIGFGFPRKDNSSVNISMLIFRPNSHADTYSKQMLHDDEKPYFKAGNKQIIIDHDRFRIAPAICFESLQVSHLKKSLKMGANIYIASVAKSQKGIEKAIEYFPKMARKHNIPILMTNCIGYCDNFESAGQSSVWNKRGELLAQLPSNIEAILIYDTVTEKSVRINKPT